MRITIIQSYYIYISSESPSHVRIQTCARKCFPIQLLAFLHRLIRFIYSSVQIQNLPEFQVRLQLPGKFLLVVLFQLLLYNCDDLGYFIVLTSAKLSVDFFITVVTCIQVYETFQSCIVISLELIPSIFTFSHVSHFLYHIGHYIGDRGIIILKCRINSINIVFMLLLIRSRVSLNMQDILLRLLLIIQFYIFFLFPQGQNDFLYFFLIVFDMWVVNNGLHNIALYGQWIDGFALGVRDYLHLMHLICAISASHYYLLSVINIIIIVIKQLLQHFISNYYTFYFFIPYSSTYLFYITFSLLGQLRFQIFLFGFLSISIQLINKRQVELIIYIQSNDA